MLCQILQTQARVGRTCRRQIKNMHPLRHFFGKIFFKGRTRLAAVADYRLQMRQLACKLNNSIRCFVFDIAVQAAVTLTIAQRVPQCNVMLVQQGLFGCVILRRSFIQKQRQQTPEAVLRMRILFLLLQGFYPRHGTEYQYSALLVCYRCEGFTCGHTFISSALS